MSLTFETTVFTDPQGEAAAKIYVVAVPTRDVSDEELAAYRLGGTIIGPTCKYSSTLQTRIPFRHRGFTPCGYRTALVAEAIVPDPCYWSPELPFLYRAVGEVKGDMMGATSFDQMFGIRSVGTIRNRLTFNGKVWVPRGVADRCVNLRSQQSFSSLSEWHATDTMMYVEAVSDALGREASEVGVMLATEVDALDERADEVLIQLSRYPAVVLVSMGRTGPIDRRLQTASRNVLLGHYNAAEPPESVDATRFGLVEMIRDSMVWDMKDAAASGLPALAVRLTRFQETLVAARAECDRVQRLIAQTGEEAAGYFVI